MANLIQRGFRFFHVDPERKVPKRHPVSLTALWALKGALREERYEDCAEIIAIAKEFGAEEREIYYLLEDPRRNP